MFTPLENLVDLFLLGVLGCTGYSDCWLIQCFSNTHGRQWFTPPLGIATVHAIQQSKIVKYCLHFAMKIVLSQKASGIHWVSEDNTRRNRSQKYFTNGKCCNSSKCYY